MEEAKDFLIKAADMADMVMLTDGAARDRSLSALHGYISGLRDAYLVMAALFEDAEAEIKADDKADD